MPAYRQRVFLSFTSEFLKYPEQDGSGQGSGNGKETFVAAAKRACSEMELDCIEMGTFDPAECTGAIAKFRERDRQKEWRKALLEDKGITAGFFDSVRELERKVRSLLYHYEKKVQVKIVLKPGPAGDMNDDAKQALVEHLYDQIEYKPDHGGIKYFDHKTGPWFAVPLGSKPFLRLSVERCYFKHDTIASMVVGDEPVVPGTAEPTPVDKWRDYLEQAREEHRYLPLQAFTSGIQARVPLEEVYVHMRAVNKTRGAPGLDNRLGLGEALGLMRSGDGANAMVVLGHPGSGKSSLLKHVLNLLADGQGKEKLGLEGEPRPFYLPATRWQPGEDLPACLERCQGLCGLGRKAAAHGAGMGEGGPGHGWAQIPLGGGVGPGKLQFGRGRPWACHRGGQVRRRR